MYLNVPAKQEPGKETCQVSRSAPWSCTCEMLHGECLKVTALEDMADRGPEGKAGRGLEGICQRRPHGVPIPDFVLVVKFLCYICPFCLEVNHQHTHNRYWSCLILEPPRSLSSDRLLTVDDSGELLR